MNKELKFNVVLINGMDVLLMDEPKIFTLHVIPTDASPYTVSDLKEDEINEHIAVLIRQSFKI